MSGVNDTSPPSASSTAVATLTVDGMHCQSCAALIEETLTEDLGVAGAKVDLEGGVVVVTYDPAVYAIDDLCAGVLAAGYQATPSRT